MNNRDFKEILNGNKELLAYYLLNYSKTFYRIAYAITNNKDDSEDAISNTVLKVYSNIKNLKEPKFFKTWATRILINECKLLIRSGSKLTELENVKNEPNEEIDYMTIAVKQLIEKLDENHRDIVILYYFDDYSIKEISQILEIEEGTVKSRLSRARDELKKMHIERLLS